MRVLTRPRNRALVYLVCLNDEATRCFGATCAIRACGSMRRGRDTQLPGQAGQSRSGRLEATPVEYPPVLVQHLCQFYRGS